jgi:DNA replication and repair protein RecF
MHLKSIYLRNFRNYAEAEIDFSSGINILRGENAQGKTNLLEAIYLVATGRSFRAEELENLIRQGEPFFYLEAKIIKEKIEHTVQISYDGSTKKLTLDNNAYGTLQHLIGLLPSVLYTPADADLIDGSPSVRRRFLNIHLAQKDPLYMHHLARFWRAMKQRNSLLKTKQPAGIECWETEMASSAAYLLQQRLRLIEQIAPFLRSLSKSLSGKEEIDEIRYHPSHPPSLEGYLAQMQKNRVRELQLGMTLTGPHRDDFTLWIEGKEAQKFASEGQKKTAIAALRLAEWELLTQAAETPALLGIDDLGLHLDASRHTYLRNRLGSLGQVFITCPHSPSIWKEFDQARTFLISEGRILT